VQQEALCDREAGLELLELDGGPYGTAYSGRASATIALAAGFLFDPFAVF